ncbi:lasso peptide biosynthesis B2 protein [Rhodobacteraceae bacterium N5(2021)]|uniref:Lasso peptide biosynthesis B2 protein n=1 Tax=Gymnodinialimonas phycosphaerae TaxID=2841589 RepID=A0A975TY56_9RHOB|nr:lasso peptide biosynthesis B2 protein [Gymnodinialimonas phycosphaerae]MBY4892149.1 lasso peptide biosynthesis B2 protein [Gymnodinialimonas phycosphaerae]
MVLVHKFAAFVTMPKRERALLIEAAAALVRAQVRIKIRPFPAIAAGLGREVRDVGLHGQPDRLEETREIASSVRRAARVLPTKAMCLPRAMALKTMLDRRAIASVCVVGVRDSREAVGVDAHAWVEVAGEIVIGGDRSRQYIVLTSYI